MGFEGQGHDLLKIGLGMGLCLQGLFDGQAYGPGADLIFFCQVNYPGLIQEAPDPVVFQDGFPKPDALPLVEGFELKAEGKPTQNRVFDGLDGIGP